MRHVYRRLVAVLGIVGVAAFLLLSNVPSDQFVSNQSAVQANGPAVDALRELAIKGRAPKTGYSREAFGGGWKTVKGCDTRQIILNRDLRETVVDDQCRVISGVLTDPYSAKEIRFTRDQASRVQIDHVVALSDAWQKGAQLLTAEQRTQLANDPLELLAVDGQANQGKSDGDAATWLPDNQPFRCEYVSRQIAVKRKYALWVTQAEYDAMNQVLSRCPEYPLFQ